MKRQLNQFALAFTIWILSPVSVVGQDWPMLSQETVDAAVEIPLIRYNRYLSGGAHTHGAWYGGASVVLALSSYLGNTSSDDRLLQQIRYSITGGNEITANGGYPSQHERHVTGMFAIVRLTPRIWNELSSSEKDSIDLLMTASLVSTAFTTNDGNPYIKSGTQQHTMDGDPSIDRSWNPNLREGMIGGVLVGMVYFGGVVEARAVLDEFDYDDFLAKLQLAGLTNLYETYNWKNANPSGNAPTGKMIEDGIEDYHLWGVAYEDYLGIYDILLTNTFGRIVSCGLNDGQGIDGGGMILDGCDQLPNKGKLGMLKEFDSVDAPGYRSSALYSYDGYRCHQTNLLVMLVGGYITPENAESLEVYETFNIGATDLWYKIEHGYVDYFKGKKRATFDMSLSDSHGFQYIRGLMNEFIVPVLTGLSSGVVPLSPTNLRIVGSVD